MSDHSSITCKHEDTITIETDKGPVEIKFLAGKKGRVRMLVRGPDGVKIERTRSTDIDCSTKTVHNEGDN